MKTKLTTLFILLSLSLLAQVRPDQQPILYANNLTLSNEVYTLSSGSVRRILFQSIDSLLATGTISEITNVSDTSTISGAQKGDLAINSTNDSLMIRGTYGWVVFSGGGSNLSNSDLTLTGNRTLTTGTNELVIDGTGDIWIGDYSGAGNSGYINISDVSNRIDLQTYSGTANAFVRSGGDFVDIYVTDPGAAQTFGNWSTNSMDFNLSILSNPGEDFTQQITQNGISYTADDLENGNRYSQFRFGKFSGGGSNVTAGLSIIGDSLPTPSPHPFFEIDMSADTGQVIIYNQPHLDDFGSGTYAEAYQYGLGVNADGDIIEIERDSMGGGGSQTLSRSGDVVTISGGNTVDVHDWFNVVDYGADGSDTVDDTEAIQAAINAAFANYGGTVYFPNGIYYISDTIVTNDNNGRNPNSQLYIPAIDSTQADSIFTLVLKGQTGPNVLVPNGGTWGAAYNNTQTGVVLYSQIAGVDAESSIIGTKGRNFVGTGDFNFMALVIEDLEFRVKHNPNGSGPELSGLNMGWMKSLVLDNVRILVDTVASEMVNPTAGVYGVRFPVTWNAPRQNAIDVRIEGFTYGIIVSDHFWSRTSYIAHCKYAVAMTDAAHSIHFDKILSQRNNYVFTYLADDKNPDAASAKPVFTVDDMSLEPHGAASPAWNQPTFLVYDPENKLTGIVRYYNEQGVGYGTGGTGIRWIDLETPFLELGKTITTVTPSGAGAAIDFASRYSGYWRIDMSSTAVEEAVTFSNPNTKIVPTYKLHIDNVSNDTLAFPSTLKTPSREQVGTRTFSKGSVIEIFYDGTDYFVVDTASLGPAVAAAIVQPSEIDSLFYWFKADAGVLDSVGGAIADFEGVGTWGDQSGNSYNTTQGTATRYPQYRSNQGPNSTAALYFDGSNDFLSSSSHWWGSDDFEIFIVMKMQNATRDANESILARIEGGASVRQFLIQPGGSAASPSYAWTFGTSPDGTNSYAWLTDNAKSASWKLYNVSWSGSTRAIYDNGSDTSASESGNADKSIYNNGTIGLVIGALNATTTPANHANVWISEIIVFSKQLNATERGQMEDYINNKYSLF